MRADWLGPSKQLLADRFANEAETLPGAQLFVSECATSCNRPVANSEIAGVNAGRIGRPISIAIDGRDIGRCSGGYGGQGVDLRT
jgi:hypothetical protein